MESERSSTTTVATPLFGRAICGWANARTKRVASSARKPVASRLRARTIPIIWRCDNHNPANIGIRRRSQEGARKIMSALPNEHPPLDSENAQNENRRPAPKICGPLRHRRLAYFLSAELHIGRGLDLRLIGILEICEIAL